MTRPLTADLFITLDGAPHLSNALVSRTLTKASWGKTEVVNSDEALIALKRRQGSPMRIMGSVSLVQRLLHARALDRLRLVVLDYRPAA